MPTRMTPRDWSSSMVIEICWRSCCST